MLKVGGQAIPSKTLLLLTSECSLILVGLVVATFLRFWQIAPTWDYLSTRGTLVRFAAVIIICELALYFNDIYDLQLVRRRSALFVQLLQAIGTAALVLAICYYINPDLGLDRGIAL